MTLLGLNRLSSTSKRNENTNRIQQTLTVPPWTLFRGKREPLKVFRNLTAATIGPISEIVELASSSLVDSHAGTALGQHNSDAGRGYYIISWMSIQYKAMLCPSNQRGGFLFWFFAMCSWRIQFAGGVDPLADARSCIVISFSAVNLVKLHRERKKI